ncbi:unnamed protein product [Brugia pahangi]|uniref:Uncharacterized protein n=1 Tax=Brugia pahangi TaxID=6280 RepID=A0A3P7U0C5_BRUPA|nr:unnamed protein product [Brugia pahangi]
MIVYAFIKSSKFYKTEKKKFFFSIDKGLIKQWLDGVILNPLVDKSETKRWWSGNFKPWDGDFEPWRESNGGEEFVVFPGGRFGAWGDLESNGGEEFVVFPGGRFGAWGDRIFIDRKE